ncbi:hypothetical protein MNBD_GAMMA12-2472 [hydrothermal vent metagenome]|uniref:Uncharacterized protein n=1 Tax=hydrothermal vent metagenome TaxID=652676 RepID=A0A3B0YL34_9ZZZZ
MLGRRHRCLAWVLASLYLVGANNLYATTENELYLQGLSLASKGKLKLAQITFRLLLIKSPFYNEANYSLVVIKDLSSGKLKPKAAAQLFTAIYLAKKEEYKKSLVIFSSLIENKTNYSGVYFFQGLTFIAVENIPSAIQSYKVAIALESTYSHYPMMLAAAYFKMKSYNNAIVQASKAINMKSKSIIAYLNRASSYHNKGLYKKAVSDFNNALKYNPRSAIAYIGRGAAYQKSGQLNLAIFDFEKAVTLEPNNFFAYYNRAAAYFLQGSYKMAIRDYTTVIKLNPYLASSYVNRGILYVLKLRNYKLGCADFKKACELGNCQNYTYSQRRSQCQ